MLILSIEVLPKQTESLRSRLRACEAGGSIKPGAQAPGSIIKTAPNPRSGRQPMDIRTVTRFTGSVPILIIDPGACAPGFMLPPASQAKEPTLANSGGERVHCFK